MSRLYFMVIIVACFGQKTCSGEESFELFRGYRDVFSNSPDCSQTGSSDDESGQGYDLMCSDRCNSFGAECYGMDCSFCICSDIRKRTYIGYRSYDHDEGGCVRDEDIVPESVPNMSFGVVNNNAIRCIAADNFDANVITKTWQYSFSPETRWIRIKGMQLMNIKTLQCLAFGGFYRTGKWRAVMRQCNLRPPTNKLYCKGNGRISIISKKQNKNYCLKLRMNKPLLVHAANKNSCYMWKLYTTHHRIPNPCLSNDLQIKAYKGCYRFTNGSFLRFLSFKELCHNNGSCTVHKELMIYFRAPIFVQNTNCFLNWRKSNYLRHGHPWKPVNGNQYYFSLQRIIKGDKRILKVNGNAFKIWNGSIIKLHITCESPTNFKNRRKTEEHHCVLLKFETLPKHSEVIPSKVSSSTKAIAISVSLVLLFVIICLVVGFLVVYTRRKRGEPERRTSEEEMQSRESSNFPRNSCVDPSQMYEPLTQDRQETDTEHLYQGLVELDSQGHTASDIYAYIDDKGITNPGVGVEDEYSYSSNDNLARPFAASQPPPSAPVIYQTLEEPETSDNPTFECERLTDKGQDSKNEPFGQQIKNPVYQTLEEPEVVETSAPVVYQTLEEPETSAIPPLECEKGQDFKKEPFDEQPENPVYQTLEGPEAVENPKLKLHDESTDKGLDSDQEPLHQQNKNPAYQTLEEPEAVENRKLKIHDELNDKSLDSDQEPLHQQNNNPVYQSLEEPEAVENPKLKLHDELNDKSLDSDQEPLHQQNSNPVYQTLDEPEAVGNPK